MTLHAIVYNPASGRRPGSGLAREVARIFEQDGHATRLLPTERAGHASEIVETLLRERADDATDVLALGGDGTLNEVLRGALRSGTLGPGHEGVRLGVLPAGTTNVVSRSLGLPLHPIAAAQALRAGRDRRIDVGLCRIHATRHPFLLACGAGFDAESLQRVSPVLKRVLGQAAYQVAALLSTGDRRRGLVADIETADGRRESVACASLVAGASELYAGILRLSPTALPDDGLLEVVLFSSTRFGALARACWAAGRSSMESAPGVRVVKARSLRVSAGIDVPVHVDAEPAGLLPAEIGILPRVLRMRVG